MFNSNLVVCHVCSSYLKKQAASNRRYSLHNHRYYVFNQSTQKYQWNMLHNTRHWSFLSCDTFQHDMSCHTHYQLCCKQLRTTSFYLWRHLKFWLLLLCHPIRCTNSVSKRGRDKDDHRWLIRFEICMCTIANIFLQNVVWHVPCHVVKICTCRHYGISTRMTTHTQPYVHTHPHTHATIRTHAPTRTRAHMHTRADMRT